jgi:hypothetical protein
VILHGGFMNRLLHNQTAIFLLCSLLLLGVSACGPKRPIWSFEQVKQERPAPASGWWRASFRMKWPEDTQPSWHLDLFLAHEVILPVLNEHGNRLALWRFHRRAVRDKSGHQFSFIFYASQETAHQIYDSLKSNALLKEMMDRGLVVQDIYEDTSEIAKPNIEDASDDNWSPQIQRSWPYFIMGVSQMWLTSIGEIAGDLSAGYKPSSLQEILAFYQQVNENLKRSWQEEGGHSMLHHLYAIFGYEPVKIDKADILIGF